MSVTLAKAILAIRADASGLKGDLRTARSFASSEIAKLRKTLAVKVGGQFSKDRIKLAQLEGKGASRQEIAEAQALQQSIRGIDQKRVALKQAAKEEQVNAKRQKAIEKELLNLAKRRTKSIIDGIKRRHRAALVAKNQEISLEKKQLNSFIRLQKRKRDLIKQAEKARLASIKKADRLAQTSERKRLSALKRQKTGLIQIAALMTSVASLGLGRFIGGTIVEAGRFEQLNVAFETILGGAEKARLKIKELQDFATRTPFTLPGVEASARSLLAVGFTAEELLPTLKTLGDVAAGLGRGEEGLRRLILNLGQVKAQAKLTGRELRDFAILGVPIIKALGDRLGKTTVEIQEMTQAGTISSDIVVAAFKDMTEQGGIFADLMTKINKTTIGLFSNIKDEITLLRRAIGENLIPSIRSAEEATIGWLQSMREAVEANKGISTGALLAAEATLLLASALFAANVAAQFFAVSIGRIIALTGIGIILVLVSAVLGALIGKFFEGGKEAEKFGEKIEEMNNAMQDAIEQGNAMDVTLGGMAGTMKSKLSPIIGEVIDKLRVLNDIARDIGKQDLRIVGNTKGITAFLDKSIVGKELRNDLRIINMELSELVNKLRAVANQKSEAAELREEYNKLAMALKTIIFKQAIFGIKEFGAEGKKAANSIKEAMGLVLQKMNDLLGITKKLKDAQDELDLLQGKRTKFDLLFEKLIEDEVRAEEALKLIEILKKIEKTKKDIEFEKKIKSGREDREKKFEGIGKSVFEATRKPIEKFRARVAELKEVLARGIIGPATFKRALEGELKGVASAILADRKALEPKPLLKAGRSGFAELGTRIQDALLGRDADARDEKRNNLLKKGIIKQEELIKEFQKFGKIGLGP